LAAAGFVSLPASLDCEMAFDTQQLAKRTQKEAMERHHHHAITNEHNVWPVFLTTTQPFLLSHVSIASVSITELSDMFDLIIKTCSFSLQEFNIFFLNLFLHSH
jgi:hypothetical protein